LGPIQEPGVIKWLANAAAAESAACGSPLRRAYPPYRSCGRVAEGGGLLNRYRVVKPYRGFESLRLRHPAARKRALQDLQIPPRCACRIVRVPPCPQNYQREVTFPNTYSAISPTVTQFEIIRMTRSQSGRLFPALFRASNAKSAFSPRVRIGTLSGAKHSHIVKTAH
jgi:hypothetical protein